MPVPILRLCVWQKLHVGPVSLLPFPFGNTTLIFAAHVAPQLKIAFHNLICSSMWPCESTLIRGRWAEGTRVGLLGLDFQGGGLCPAARSPSLLCGMGVAGWEVELTPSTVQ